MQLRSYDLEFDPVTYILDLDLVVLQVKAFSTNRQTERQTTEHITVRQ